MARCLRGLRPGSREPRTADGRAFAVTDNDGVDGASGEKLLLSLGADDRLF